MIFGKKKKMVREDDRVWATTALKLNGIGDEILKEMDSHSLVLLVAHFQKTLKELQESIRSRNLKGKLLEATSDFDPDKLGREGVKVAILDSEIIRDYKNLDFQSGAKGSPSKKIRVVVAEHYPIPERDADVIFYASSLPYSTILCFHIALDEPLMRLFGAERVVGLLKKLGWDEKESITHPMVTSAIGNAQKKVKKEASGDQRVGSMEEWFTYNLPSSREDPK